MTKIQKKSIPVLLQHKNVIVKSETGSGKTLAYLIPAFEMLIKINLEKKIQRKDGPIVIILAPTHELCIQIENTYIQINSACIHAVSGTLLGGQQINHEKSKLRKGVNVLICTPGRLLYHLNNTTNLNFENLKLIIFDEADRLLDMGFEKDIKSSLKIILSKVSLDIADVESFKRYRIFLISATIDEKIRSLVQYLMKGYKSVGFEPKKDENENEYNVPDGLTQYYSIIQDEFRLMHLLSFLFSKLGKKIIVFVSTCATVDLIELFLKEFHFLTNKMLFNNANILKLHGKMNHQERKVIFKDFNKNEPGILICTDVVARGLDFPLVDWILHYDINPDPKDYLNRMGRTARLNQTGNSLLFLMGHEETILKTSLSKFKIEEFNSGKILLSFVKKFNMFLEKENLLEKEENYDNNEGNYNSYPPIECIPQSFEDEVDINEKYRKKYIFIIYPLQKAIKDFIFEKRENLLLAKTAFRSSTRSYSSFFKIEKDVFNVKNINLTRYARSFGLYKESSKIKLGEEEYVIDYHQEKLNTKGNKKFNNKKYANKLIISEFN